MNSPLFDPIHDASSAPLLLHVEAKATGRLLVRVPAAGDGPWPLLLGFHGYAETAEAHLPRLEAIPGASKRFVVASLQALHPFYKLRTGDVVASWMTKLDRDLAIASNNAYVLDAVARVREVAPLTGEIVCAGFSQGATMAWRATRTLGPACSGVIACGGDIPSDAVDAGWPDAPPALIGRGATDDWYPEGKLARDLATLSAAGAGAPRVVRFPGGHGWPTEFAASAGDFLDDLFPPD